MKGLRVRGANMGSGIVDVTDCDEHILGGLRRRLALACRRVVPARGDVMLFLELVIALSLGSAP